MLPELNLEVDKSTNSKVLRLFDTSLYCGIDNPENFILEIAAPSSKKWVTFKVNREFSLVLNSSSLKLNNPKTTKGLADLPDGVYTIRMSVKPNIQTLVEFDHLRTAQLQSRYANILCKIYSEQCSIPKQEFVEKKLKLLSIFMDIQAAIAKVEVCHETKEGIELYEKAKADLNSFSDECGC